MASDDLFGDLLSNDENYVKQPAEIILSPITKDLENTVGSNLYRYSRDVLYNTSRPFISVLSSTTWEVDCDDSDPVVYKARLKSIVYRGSSQRKEEHIWFLCQFLCNDDNFRQIFLHFPKPILDALNKLAISRVVNIEEDKVFTDIFKLSGLYRGHATLDYGNGNYDSLFRIMGNRYESGASVSIAPHIMDQVCNVVLDDDKKMSPIEKPETKYTFDAQNLLVAEVPQIEWFVNNGMAPATKKGISVTDLKKFVKKTNLTDFFTDSELDLERRRIRARMMYEIGPQIVNLLKKDAVEYEDVLVKSLEASIRSCSFVAVLASLVSNEFGDKTYQNFALATINYLTKNCNKGWYSAADLADVILKSKSLSNTVNRVFIDVCDSVEYIFYTYYKSYKNIDSYEAQELYFCEIIYGTIFAMASVGMVEIAYDNGTRYSWFAGLKSFRLTPLGRKAFGYDSDYKRGGDNIQPMQLDDSILLIKVPTEDAIGFNSIKEVAVKVSDNRYRVTEESFLKPCSNHIDLLRRIKSFETIFDANIPKNWQNFFAELKTNSNLLEDVTDDDYVVFKLKKADNKLMRILSEDAAIRKVSQRATGHIVLVKKKDYSKFKTILAKYGYLLDQR
jgi:hypothetical protein